MRLVNVPLAGLPASSPFLGRAALRPALGQVEFTDPWGTRHTFTAELPGTPILPFDPRQSLAYQDRILKYKPQIEKTARECEVLKANAEAHEEFYQQMENPTSEALQAANAAIKAFNDCIDKKDTLINYMDFGEPTPTTANIEYEWPAEVPKPGEWPPPESTPQPTPPPVASVHEVPPKPAVEPVPPPAEPAPVASVDWRTTGCRPGTSRIVPGGACVPAGLVSTALTTPGVPAGGATTTASSFLKGRVPTVPLYAGRF